MKSLIHLKSQLRIVTILLFAIWGLTMQSHPIPLSASPPREHTIKIVALSNLSGHFLPDEAGQGGLPALATLLQRERIGMSNRGSVIAVHSGDFSGASSIDPFLRKLHAEGMTLPERIGFDAIGYSPVESKFLLQKKIPFEKSRAVSITSASDLLKRERLISAGAYTIYVTSITEATDPVQLNRLLKERPDSSLTVILDNRGRLEPEILSSIERPQPEERVERSLERTLYILSGTARSLFHRRGSGLLICEISGIDLCEIEFRLREDSVISVQNRIQTLNGKDRVHAYIPHDPSVYEALSR